jgi:hypothetical protein
MTYGGTTINNYFLQKNALILLNWGQTLQKNANITVKNSLKILF